MEVATWPLTLPGRLTCKNSRQEWLAKRLLSPRPTLSWVLLHSAKRKTKRHLPIQNSDGSHPITRPSAWARSIKRGLLSCCFHSMSMRNSPYQLEISLVARIEKGMQQPSRFVGTRSGFFCYFARSSPPRQMPPTYTFRLHAHLLYIRSIALFQ